MANIFGKLFTITTWGESHGGSIGVTIDGCPPQLSLSAQDVQTELNRRQPGQSNLTTQRQESDQVEILSGLYKGQTLGTPITMIVKNEDARSQDYRETKTKYRPSHADFTYHQKYGIYNPEGGGRSSARETVGRVAAGAVAKKILKDAFAIEICAYVEQVHQITADIDEDIFPSTTAIERTPIRCPNESAATQMTACIEKARTQGDSVGGTIVCRIKNTPIGLGAPVFDRLEADLAKAMLCIPATKGFEIGSGFSGTRLKGSGHNDPFIQEEGQIKTETNHAGGVLGGISNGNEIYFRVGFKPTSTILQKQKTVDHEGQEAELTAQGRHDPCVLPRAVPIVESMAALVLVDHWMLHIAQTQAFNF